METNSPAEELPALYRAILDRVAELEASGDRAEASRVRRSATHAYSRAWDERARRQLIDLLRVAERPRRAAREGILRRGSGIRRDPLGRPRPAVASDH